MADKEKNLKNSEVKLEASNTGSLLANLLSCPKCLSGKVHRSRAKWRDGFAALIGLKPFRCDRCEARFYLRAKAQGA